MTLEDKFKATAQALVRKFSLGDVTRTYSEIVVPAARYAIEDGKDGTKSNRTSTIMVAGLDLGEFVPAKGATIVYVNGDTFRLVEKRLDQYKAAYYLDVKNVT